MGKRYRPGRAFEVEQQRSGEVKRKSVQNSMTPPAQRYPGGPNRYRGRALRLRSRSHGSFLGLMAA